MKRRFFKKGTKVKQPFQTRQCYQLSEGGMWLDRVTLTSEEHMKSFIELHNSSHVGAPIKTDIVELVGLLRTAGFDVKFKEDK